MPERPSPVNDPASVQQILQPLQGSVYQAAPPTMSSSQIHWRKMSDWSRRCQVTSIAQIRHGCHRVFIRSPSIKKNLFQASKTDECFDCIVRFYASEIPLFSKQCVTMLSKKTLFIFWLTKLTPTLRPRVLTSGTLLSYRVLPNLVATLHNATKEISVKSSRSTRV